MKNFFRDTGDADGNGFFRKPDWFAFGFTFLFALTVYVLTLAPTVTLEDSGELCVAPDYLGVPHPPGYPIWAVLTWFFQWVFHKVTFHGHPNPAWAVNLFSAVAGAAACGVLALLVSRSGRDLLRSMKRETHVIGERTERLFCMVGGIAAGLLLAFGQGMWSQSVITEVYSLNIFFETLILLFVYRWIMQPERTEWILAAGFAIGLGFTNHQTIIFLSVALAAAILFRDLKLFRDFAITGLFFVLMLAANKFVGPEDEWAWLSGPENVGFWFWTAYAIIVPVIARFALKNGKTVCYTFLLMELGLAFYLYEPFASEQNTPINWGYPRTWRGFLHAITRGQYERVKAAHILQDPAKFIHQCEAFFNDLRSQYLPLVLTAFLPFSAWRIKRFNAAWAAIVAFVAGAGLFTLDTIITLKFPQHHELATLLNNLADPCMALLFVLFAIGFSLAVVNIVEAAIRKCKAMWNEGGFWNFVATLIAGLVALSIVLLAPYASFKLLANLVRDGARQSAMDNAIILMAALLPFLLAGGVIFLKHWKKTALRFSVSEISQQWFVITMLAFIATSLGYLMLWNAATDIQTLFIGRVQFIQSHSLYCIWIGYGLLLLMAEADVLMKNRLWARIAIVSAILALPVLLVIKNYVDPRQEFIVGGSEQNGHDFGWQFGNWQLRGVKGIEEDLRAWYPPETFEKIWAEYPNKAYPPPMETNAIFFGGTDPGRFVPTYMIYSAHVRPDVYLITQNALADNTYMAVMRDLYGDQIWIPSPIDSNRAFKEYIDGIRSGKIRAGANVSTENGKVQVQGVQGVMEINGILTKMIFERNQYRTETKTDEKTRPVGAAVVYENPPLDPKTGLPPKRAFYVEESYALRWMYPYLTPHGLIMKINDKPTPLSPEIIKNDTDFWNWYCARLVNDKRFMRDVVARKSFSKLRSSIAGLYAARGRRREAEYAFRQAISLYDLTPEAHFRLAQLLMSEGRFDEAISLFESFLSKDVNNDKARRYLELIRQQQKEEERKRLLEKKFQSKSITPQEALTLSVFYFRNRRIARGTQVADWVLDQPGLRPDDLLGIAQLAAQNGRFELIEKALKKYVAMRPNDPMGWINLSALHLLMNKQNETYDTLKKAVEAGGDSAIDAIREDHRFDSIRNTKRFREIVPPSTLMTPMNLSLPGIPVR